MQHKIFRADRDEFIIVKEDDKFDENYQKNYEKFADEKWTDYGDFDLETMETTFSHLNRLYTGTMNSSIVYFIF